MHKAIIISIALMISVMVAGVAGCRQAYADEGKSPITLTKEVTAYIDQTEEERPIPDTGDKVPVTIVFCAVVLTGGVGMITVRTTVGKHKNS